MVVFHSQRLLRLVVVWSVVSPLAAADPPPATNINGTEKNAALAYWQAFALIPEAPGDDQQAVLSAADSMDLEYLKQANHRPAAEKLVAASEASLRLMHAGAAMPRCDWQVLNEGPGTLLPHLSKARALARLSLVRARLRAVDGDLAGAVADLADLYHLARDVDDGVLVEVLVGLAIERGANAATTQILPRLKPDQAAQLLKSLNRLPAAATFADAILAEKEVFGGWLLKELRGKKPAEIRAAIEAIGATETLALMVQGPEVMNAMLADFVKEYDRMAELSRQPDAAAKLKAQEEQFKDSNNVFIRLLMPAARKAFESIEKARVEFEEVKSALAAQAK